MKKSIFILLFILSGKVLDAHPGIGLVYDGQKTIFYTDLNHVWKLDTETGLKEVAVENVHTHELFLDATGNLFGEHYWYEASEKQFKNYIWSLNHSGKLSVIRETQDGENTDFGFVREQELAVYDIHKRDGKYEIIRQDSSNTTVLHTAARLNPGWKFLGADGTFYFTNHADLLGLEKGNLSIIAKDLSSFRIPFFIQSEDHSLYGIWTDDLNNVYVAVYSGRAVKKIDRRGQITTALKTGFLWSPLNGVFDKENNLWLMESTLNGKIRVRKVEAGLLNGNASFLFENVLLTLLGIIFIAVLFLFVRNRIRFFGKF